MAKIQIIMKKASSEYIYVITNTEKNSVYVSESAYKTQKEALEEARKYCDTQIFNKNSQKLFPISKTKSSKRNKLFKIKKLYITDGGYKLVCAGVFFTVTTISILGAIKTFKDIKSIFPEQSQTGIETERYNNKTIITTKDCNFENLHIILRTARNETREVGIVTSDMLTKLGVSNEIVSKDSDLPERVSNALENTNGNVVVINLEAGYENTESNNTIIMGDASNRRNYSSDILASCIIASLNEYSLSPIIKSGESSGIWRSQSYIEKDLTNNSLIDSVSQLTIDLPLEITEDQIKRNDAAASIVEGIMRWASLDITERYKNIYYTAQYGDTLITISESFGISIKDMEINSDINMHKGVRVGNTILTGPIPAVATNNVSVYNPCITTDSTRIKEVINTYVVQSGDTVTKIANMYGVKPEDILVPSGNQNNIYPGDTLYITTYNLYETHKKTDYIEPKQL